MPDQNSLPNQSQPPTHQLRQLRPDEEPSASNPTLSGPDDQTLPRHGRGRFQRAEQRKLRRQPLPAEMSSFEEGTSEFPPLPVPLMPSPDGVTLPQDSLQSLGRSSMFPPLPIPPAPGVPPMPVVSLRTPYAPLVLPPDDPVTTTSLTIGKRGFDKFELLGELGRGGMGVIHLAKDHELRRDIAIKLLQDPTHAELSERFVEEAQIAGQLEHPNIVPVHELGTDSSGRPFIAMKRVYGRNLRQIIDGWDIANRPLDSDALREILDIFYKVCDAVAFAHYRGVIHRDLKPENVMVGTFGEVHVLDWGLAKPIRNQNSGTRQVSSDRQERGVVYTVRGMVLGTPAYMPPEQARGEIEAVDEKSDVFALGSILYQMLALSCPYDFFDAAHALMAAQTHQLEPPIQRAPHRRIPHELNDIVMRAMAREKADRYQSVEALKTAIRHWDTGQTSTQRRAKGTLSALFHNAGGAIAAAIVALVVGMAIGATVFVESPTSSAPSTAANSTGTDPNDPAISATALAAAKSAAIEETMGRLKSLVAMGRSAEAWRELGVANTLPMPTAVQEFQRDLEAVRAEELPLSYAVRRMSAAEIAQAIAGYEGHFAAHVALGDIVPISAADYFALGLLYESGQYDMASAISAYSDALALDPLFAPARLQRALAHLWLAEYGPALRDCNAVIAVDSENPEAYIVRARINIVRGDSAAMEDAETALRLAPTSAVAFHARAIAHFSLGQRAQYEADTLRAIEANPKFLDAHIERLTVTNSANYATVLETLAPMDLLVRDALAHFYARNSTPDQVTAAWTTIARNPQYWRGWLLLSQLGSEVPINERTRAFSRATNLAPHHVRPRLRPLKPQ